MAEITKIGAVAYDPKVVTIWEGMREYFKGRNIETDYVLFSNYDAQVDALQAGAIDIAWNTNVAYIKLHRQTKGNCTALAMRDTDASFTTKIITRIGTGIERLEDLKGKRMALGSRDSGHAAILPVYFLKQAGIEPDRDIQVTRFDVDVGKHGDTGTSEAEVLRAIQAGEADAGAVGDPYWARALSEGWVDRRKLKAVWTSPSYCHCNFTVLGRSNEQRFQKWTDTLLAMDYNDPAHRKIMDMEGLKQWVRPRMEGYQSLFEAVEALRTFAEG
jgi:phosphate/phosphite/phosphonate ABC transporter binding protein